MRPVTLLHTADVHLGTCGPRGGGLEEQAFERVIDLAVEADVDAVLIVGDLFDHARVDDDLLGWTAKQLDRAGRPVALMVGNHDPLDGSSVHHRFRVADRCERVVLLDEPEGSVVRLPGTQIAVWGRAMVRHHPGFRPLEGVPPKPEGMWAVVSGHGLVTDGGGHRHHGSPISPAELAAVDWDYIALGHHHGHTVVQEHPCPAVYPGATARSRRGEPGAVMVHLSPEAGAEIEWVSLAGPVTARIGS